MCEAAGTDEVLMLAGKSCGLVCIWKAIATEDGYVDILMYSYIWLPGHARIVML